MHSLYRAAGCVGVMVLFLASNNLWAQEPEAPAEAPSEDVAPPAEEPSVEEPPVEEAPPPAEPPPAAAPSAPPPLSEPVGTAAPVATAPATPVATAPAAPIATAPVSPLPPPTAPVAPLPPPEPPPAETPAAVDVAPAEEPVDPPVTDEEPKVPEAMSEIADDDEPNGFSKFSFSPQIGYSYFPPSDYEYDGLKLSVDKRNSFVVKMHLDLGGDGFAFELAPLFASEVIGGDLSSVGTDLEGGISGSFFAIGGQMNIVYRGSWGSFYPHLGIGFHGTYLFAEDIEYGAEMYGRIPLGFTWYIGKHFGLVAEFAFMIGATGIKRPTPDIDELYADLPTGVSEEDVQNIDWASVSPETAQADIQAQLAADGVNLSTDQVNILLEEQISKAVKFGSGYAFELMVGFRFP